MSDRTERYLYRCSSDKLMTHLGLIEESGDSVDWILDKGERGLWLICRKASTRPSASGSLSGRTARLEQAVDGLGPGGGLA